MLGDRFANPEFLWLFLLLPFIGYYWWKYERKQLLDVQFSSLQLTAQLPKTWRERFARLPLWLRLLAIVFFIISFYRLIWQYGYNDS